MSFMYYKLVAKTYVLLKFLKLWNILKVKAWQIAKFNSGEHFLLKVYCVFSTTHLK